MNAPIALASLVGAGLPTTPPGPPHRARRRRVPSRRRDGEDSDGGRDWRSRPRQQEHGGTRDSERIPVLSRPQTIVGTSMMTLPITGLPDQARPRRDPLRGEPNQHEATG